MITMKRRGLAGLVVAAALLPSGAWAQTASLPSDEPQETMRSVRLAASSSLTQAATGTGLSRGKRIALAAGIGAAVGVVFGEYQFGRRMDMPHGPDMLMGAGFGAGVGAVIGWALTLGRSDPPKPTHVVRVFPIVSPSRKAMAVTIAMK